ncbi:hypothetical protein EJ08DRAFT_726008 [Tothia fuscella]|uniref:Zinc finger PHD-type domain-containing protein n=1 Tax=Tothia fuscella TaxID=1048955 RepID=A0A9P4NIM2_9PEZI|nr:hypothetical protein EJ08DRAFT_726008 [Tothia fuscella]
MSSVRNSRISRTSSPFVRTTQERDEVEPKKERVQQSLDGWIEPALPAPVPSFEEHGFIRAGVVANQAPLGSLPPSNQRLKFKAKPWETVKVEEEKKELPPPVESATPEGTPPPVAAPEPAVEPARQATQGVETTPLRIMTTPNVVDGPSMSNGMGQRQRTPPRVQNGTTPTAASRRTSTSTARTTPYSTQKPPPYPRNLTPAQRMEQIIEECLRKSKTQGQPQLGLAVKRLYHESQHDQYLAEVLDATLNQKATIEHRLEFQRRLKAGKKQLKVEARSAKRFQKSLQSSSAVSGIHPHHHSSNPTMAPQGYSNATTIGSPGSKTPPHPPPPRTNFYPFPATVLTFHQPRPQPSSTQAPANFQFIRSTTPPYPPVSYPFSFQNGAGTATSSSLTEEEMAVKTRRQKTAELEAANALNGMAAAIVANNTVAAVATNAAIPAPIIAPPAAIAAPVIPSLAPSAIITPAVVAPVIETPATPIADVGEAEAEQLTATNDEEPAVIEEEPIIVIQEPAEPVEEHEITPGPVARSPARRTRRSTSVSPKKAITNDRKRLRSEIPNSPPVDSIEVVDETREPSAKRVTRGNATANAAPSSTPPRAASLAVSRPASRQASRPPNSFRASPRRTRRGNAAATTLTAEPSPNVVAASEVPSLASAVLTPLDTTVSPTRSSPAPQTPRLDASTPALSSVAVSPSAGDDVGDQTTRAQSPMSPLSDIDEALIHDGPPVSPPRASKSRSGQRITLTSKSKSKKPSSQLGVRPITGFKRGAADAGLLEYDEETRKRFKAKEDELKADSIAKKKQWDSDLRSKDEVSYRLTEEYLDSLPDGYTRPNAPSTESELDVESTRASTPAPLATSSRAKTGRSTRQTRDSTQKQTVDITAANTPDLGPGPSTPRADRSKTASQKEKLKIHRIKSPKKAAAPLPANATKAQAEKAAKEAEEAAQFEDEHDDECAVCGRDGDLIMCDSCPRVYHAKDCCDAPPADEDSPWDCYDCELAKNTPSGPLTGLFGPQLRHLQDDRPATVFKVSEEVEKTYQWVHARPGGKYGDMEDLQVAVNGRNIHTHESFDEMKTVASNFDKKVDPSTCCVCGLTVQSKPYLLKCNTCQAFWHMDCIGPDVRTDRPPVAQYEKRIGNRSTIEYKQVYFQCPRHTNQDLQRYAFPTFGDADENAAARRGFKIRQYRAPEFADVGLERGFRNKDNDLEVLVDDSDKESDVEEIDAATLPHAAAGNVRHRVHERSVKQDFLVKAKQDRIKRAAIKGPEALIDLLEPADRKPALEAFKRHVIAGVDSVLDDMAAHRVISMVNPQYEAALALNMLGKPSFSRDIQSERNLSTLFSAATTVERGGVVAAAEDMGLEEIEKMECMLRDAKKILRAKLTEKGEREAEGKRREELEEARKGFEVRDALLAVEAQEEEEEEEEVAAVVKKAAEPVAPAVPSSRREKRAAVAQPDVEEVDRPASRREKRTRRA